jgi:hypothetical protein
VKDFLGREIEEGMWLVCSGSGNKSSEYGMILFRVVEATPTKLMVVRLRHNGMPGHHLHRCSLEWRVSKSYVRSPTKYVVVHPTKEAKELFNSVVNFTKRLHSGQLRGRRKPLLDSESKSAVNWLHGQQVF